MKTTIDPEQTGLEFDTIQFVAAAGFVFLLLPVFVVVLVASQIIGLYRHVCRSDAGCVRPGRRYAA